jgi:hypothetical protein
MEKEFLFLKKMCYLIDQCRNCATEILHWKVAYAYVHEIEDLKKQLTTLTGFFTFVGQDLN